VMLLISLKIVALLACGALGLAGQSACAGDAKADQDKPSLSGVWVQTGGEMKIAFSGKDVMKLFPHGDNEVIIVICKYSLAKDGPVKAKITDFEGKEEAKEMVKKKLPRGLEFSFKWKVTDDTAELADVEGEKTELLKSHLEAKYNQKK
jgi:hypothetical protein